MSNKKNHSKRKHAWIWGGGCLISLLILGIFSDRLPTLENTSTEILEYKEFTVPEQVQSLVISPETETITIEPNITKPIKESNSVEKNNQDITQEVSTLPTDEYSCDFDENISSQNESEITNASNTIIYLTFDDGPSTEITPQILDILKEKEISATFFILDYEYGSEKENLIKREFDEGHTIALHGTSHDYSSIYSSLDALIYNYTSLNEKIYNTLGIYSNFIRFPGGSSNTISKKYCSGIMTQASTYFSENGYTYFDWNVDSDDAGSARSAESIYNNVIDNLLVGHTNIVLMHDASNKIHTLEALDNIIDYCLEQGYEFKSIDSNTPLIQHHVNN